MSWLKNVIEHLDNLRGRYTAFLVRDEASRAEVLRVLDEVRRKELNRVHGGSALESASFVDADIQYNLYGLKDTQENRVIGCLRVTTADQLAAIPDSRAEYVLEKLTPPLLGRAQVCTRLAVLRQYRKTGAAFVLLRQAYDDALAGGMLAVLLSCEPGLYAGYVRLGFRPLGGVHQAASGGFRIPMVAILHDEQYLRQVRSPMLRTLALVPRPLPQNGMQWYQELEAREGSIDPGVAFYTDHEADEVHDQLTRGLTPVGRAAVLRNAIEVKCSHGDRVLGAGDGGRSMGFVRRGAVQIEEGRRIIAVLGEGELFGEMAVVLNAARTANVAAVGHDTRVLLLSQSSLDRLENPADQAQVWRNLARVLATRMVHRGRA